MFPARLQSLVVTENGVHVIVTDESPLIVNSERALDVMRSRTLMLSSTPLSRSELVYCRKMSHSATLWKNGNPTAHEPWPTPHEPQPAQLPLPLSSSASTSCSDPHSGGRRGTSKYLLVMMLMRFWLLRFRREDRSRPRRLGREAESEPHLDPVTRLRCPKRACSVASGRSQRGRVDVIEGGKRGERRGRTYHSLVEIVARGMDVHAP